VLLVKLIMPPEDNRLALWCLTLLFTVLGMWLLIVSLAPLKEGQPVIWGRDTAVEIGISPWFSLFLGGIFLAFGFMGIRKISKDRNKFPF